MRQDWKTGESWKYDAQAQWSIFDEPRGVSSGDETLCRTAWYYFSNKLTLGGEIMSSFAPDFQALIKH